MGDDDDGFAFAAHLAQRVKQVQDLLRREHGGRLVQHQLVRAPAEHLEDLHRLFLADGHLIDFFVQIDLHAEGPDRFHRWDPDQTSLPQKDVLPCAEHFDQFEVLMDHSDAQADRVPGRTDISFFSIQQDAARVRLVDAGEHVGERGFSGNVFAQQRQDLAPVDFQVDPVAGGHAVKALGQADQLDRGRLAHSVRFSFHTDAGKTVLLYHIPRLMDR